VQLGNNIFRNFCFFDGNILVILLTGVARENAEDPAMEIKRAVRLMEEYYEEKKKEESI